MLIKINLDGSYGDVHIPVLRANSMYQHIIRVEAPFPLTNTIEVSYSVVGTNERETHGLIPTADGLWQNYISHKALGLIGKYRAGMVLMSFSIREPMIPAAAENYLGRINGEPSEPASNGEFYLTAEGFVWYYLNGWQFSNLYRIITTSSIEVPVDPNIEVQPEIVDLPEQDFLSLAGRVATSEVAIIGLDGRVTELERITITKAEAYGLLNGKVDKNTNDGDYIEVYGFKGQNQERIRAGEESIPLIIVQRNAAGHILVPAADQYTDPAVAVQKAYADAIKSDLDNRKVEKETGSRLIKVGEINKVDKIVIDGSGKNALMDDGTYKRSITEEEIDALDVKIQAIEGAFVYIGTIDNTTAEVRNTPALLTAKALELKNEVSLGFVLIDNQDVEWYYDGSTWNDMGQGQISKATETHDGLMSKEDKKKLNNDIYTKVQVDTKVNAVDQAINSHAMRIDNPHGVTAGQVPYGSSNVEKALDDKDLIENKFDNKELELTFYIDNEGDLAYKLKERN